MRLEIVFALVANALVVIDCQSLLDDKLTPFVKLARLILSDFVRPRTFNVGYQIGLRNNKVQRVFNVSQPFFCDVAGPGERSKVVPTSVHRLTPGDIDLVAAIGDSLTAANGAFAIDSLQTLLEGRGVSWSIGGKDNWRKFITLPNLLKEFNSNLYGYSTAANSLGFEKASKFNVAEPGAISRHTIRQAKNLVKRMRSDPQVDIKNHWKVVTMMVGSNDFCLDVCYSKNQDKLVEKAGEDLRLVLQILRENLPRLLVNVVLPVDVGIIFRFSGKPDECQGFHYLECPCLYSPTQSKHLEKTLQTIKKWKRMVTKVVGLDEFHNRNDFEVNLMTFTDDIKLTKPDGSTDYTFLSKDCFHLSQKGHMFTAIQLWNAMLTTPSERATTSLYRDDEEIVVKCPTQDFPYLRTIGN